jgi:two-component system phosphate regulon sensor histidine kinase PhoR
MTLAAFFLGLAIGIGFWLWRQAGLYRQMQKMLAALQTGGAEGTSLPIASRLRLGVVLANEYRQQLEMEIETWHQMLEAAPMGYLHVDEENQLLWCNNQARQLLQIQRWEPGQVRLLLEVVRSYELDQLIEKTRRHQQPNQIEWLFHPAIASSTPIQDITPQNLLWRTVALTLRASSLPLAQGQVGVFLENRQPFIEISESRDRWVSDLAHELRTPLTSISLVAEALEGRLQPPERRWVEQLSQETNRLINLVQDLLEISHLERDPTQYLKLKPVQLPSLIQAVWQNLEPLARKKQLSLEYSGPGELEIQADESRLTQVFLNLFDNSIKYSSEAGTIRVEINLLLCEDVSDQVQINIIDLGSGFPELDLPRVFERLYRGDPSRQRQQQSPISKGSGLGLAIVQQIILAHGGSIQAKNHPETGGAWLQIHLPITNS